MFTVDPLVDVDPLTKRLNGLNATNLEGSAGVLSLSCRKRRSLFQLSSIIIHEEALRAKVSMSQVLFMQVGQGLEQCESLRPEWNGLLG